MKNKIPVSLYELIVNGLKEAIENEKNKGKENDETGKGG